MPALTASIVGLLGTALWEENASAIIRRYGILDTDELLGSGCWEQLHEDERQNVVNVLTLTFPAVDGFVVVHDKRWCYVFDGC